jgi:myo-inositol-1(or 4)-monophosphatase
MAAGALLVREAGGRVTDLRGGTFHLGGREVLATNARTHREMTEVLVTLLSCRPS